ncbi:SYCY2 protein [Xyrichtys novacula]|uniref:SYCY2 protein n=1 Tax=Xyrichtys novacula TaxID=13765 RepID=A0AAV1G2L2_XYRNO|nr:SYCY2 protein [Xyrichtys novacula]
MDTCDTAQSGSTSGSPVNCSWFWTALTRLRKATYTYTSMHPLVNIVVILYVFLGGLILCNTLLYGTIGSTIPSGGLDLDFAGLLKKEGKSDQAVQRIMMHVKRAMTKQPIKHTPYLDVGLLNNRPLSEHEIQCLFYALTPAGATKPYNINNVTYLQLNAQTINLFVEYQSQNNETIDARPFPIHTMTSYPTVNFCNNLWKSMTPGFYVHLDFDMYEDFKPLILKASQKILPSVCVSPVTGSKIDYILGSVRGCPRILYIMASNPFPALDNVVWMCGEHLHTYIPPYWQGVCAPYWSDKTINFDNNVHGTEDSYVIAWPSQIDTDANPSSTIEDNNQDLKYKELALNLDNKKLFESNLWYQSLKKRVRTFTRNSCYACSLLPVSTQDLFALVAKSLTGPKGLPSWCTMAYQYVIQMHPKTRTHDINSSKFRPVIRPTKMHLGKTTHSVQKIKNFLNKVVKYVIYSNISISQENGNDIFHVHATSFNVPENHPSLLMCSGFYNKYLLNITSDLSITPHQSSIAVDPSDIFDVCLEGQSLTDGGQNMGFLKVNQCRFIVNSHTDYAQLSLMGTPYTYGFYWCCGNNVWSSLPPRFRGRCGLCMLHDVTYIVEPVEYAPQHFNSTRSRRELSEVTGYIHLKNSNPTDLATRYYALRDDFQIYTHSQLVFSTLFWNTELQYTNHYLIALTRHDLALMANATLQGFNSIYAELDLIRRFTSDNRVALDALTASQGGVCAIVGEGCCTYLPSDSEGMGNLTIAIKNLEDIYMGIVTANKDARFTGGSTGLKAWDHISALFGGSSFYAWVMGLAGPVMVIILIVAVVMCCCFPIFRALIMKSVSSMVSTSFVQTTLLMEKDCIPSPSVQGPWLSSSSSSESSEEFRDGEA